MNILVDIFSFIIHIDRHLNTIILQYGSLTYGILFVIIFMETGFVVTPFLPGDSLLFAAGAFAAQGSFDIALLFFVFLFAAIIGDSVNYAIGHVVGPKAFSGHIRFLKKEYMEKTHAYFEKYGGKTIIIARFVPIVRTFAPFVAGVGAMSYGKFIVFNIVGAFLWISLFTIAGYFFGNLEIVKHNFTIVIFVIIIISVFPGFIEYTRHKMKKRSAEREKKLVNSPEIFE